MSKKYQKQFLQSLFYEELEPRLLFSADLEGALINDPLPEENILNYAVIEADMNPAATLFNVVATDQAESQRHELVIIDSATPDYQQLLDDLYFQADDNRQIDVVMLDANHDGVSQISKILKDRSPLDAVHLISHAADGEISIGNSVLNLETLFNNSIEIQGWGDDFTKNGDLLIYGCNLAVTENGQNLTNILAQLTGTDVAASDDKTGHEDLGGDWDLEFKVGSLETSSMVSVKTQSSWLNTLANAPPVLSGANNLTSIIENPSDNPGTLVSTLISGQVTDADSGALSGIAVIGVDNTNGTWQYTVNSGGLWTDFSSPSTTAARLLAADANTYVRFVPDADWNGTVSNGITFHAWDQTSGSNGSTADLTTVTTDTVRDEFSINSFSGNDGTVNWAAAWQEIGESDGSGTGDVEADGTPASLEFGESGPGDANLTGDGVKRQVDLSAASSATLSLWAERSGSDFGSDITLAISADNSTWTDLETFAFDSTPTTNTQYSYNIDAYCGGTPWIRLIGSGTVDGDFIYFDDIQIEYTTAVNNTGGETAFSTATASSSITVEANVAPVLSGANNLTTIDEDSSNNPGTLVSSLISGQVSDADSGALSGIAVIGVDNTNGTWQYTVNSGGLWTDFSSPSTTAARLLAADANTYVRFVPDADWNGTVSNGITFHAWDQTSGSNGSTADLTTVTTDTVRDEFSINSFSGNDGTVNWAAAWQEIGESDGSGTGDVEADGTPASLEFGESGPGDANLTGDGVKRQVDLSAASSATLSLWAERSGSDFGSDITLAISADNSTWTDLETFAFDSTPTTNTQYSYNIDAYCGGTPWIRLIGSGTVDGDFIYFDDVQIEYTTAVNNTGGETAFSTATASSSITVNAVNDAPIVTAVTLGSMNEDGSRLITQAELLTGSSDIDLDSLSAINLTINTGSGTPTDNGDGTWTFDPTADWNGAVSFDFDVSDGTTTTANTASLTVTAVNDAPTVTAVTLGSMNEDGSRLITQAELLTGSSDVDLDSLSAINLTINTGSGTLTDNGDGTWTFDPTADWNGAVSFDFNVSDGTTTTANTASLTVTAINDAPVAQDDRTNLSFDGIDDYVLISDDTSLAMTNNVTIEAWINHTGAGTGSQLIINKEGEYELGITADTGEIKWAFDNVDPDWSWHNTGFFATANEWAHITVTYEGGIVKTYANGVLVDTYNGSGSIGDTYTGYNELRIGGRQNAGDQRFDGMIDEVRIWNTTRTVAEINANMATGLVGNETGLVGNWRFDEGSGTTVFDRSSYGNHGTLGGIDGVVAEPTWKGYVTDENTILNIPAVSGVLANDVDVDSDSLTTTNLNTTGTIGLVTLNNAGRFTYNPNGQFELLAAGDHATDTFTYTANDGTVDSNIVTVTITVTGVNDNPVAVDDAITATEDTVFTSTVDLDFNDTDIDGDALIVTAGTFATTQGGSLVLAADGSYTYTPAANFTGIDTVSYTITDGVLTDTGTLTITVNPVNDAPTVTAVTLGSMNEDGSRVITQAELLTGSSDIDLDTLSAINLNVNTGSGTLTDNGDGTWTFDPTADWNGAVSLDFDISDGTTTTANTASLTVTAVNDAPVAVNDAITATEDTVFTSTVDLDFNDTDIDGDALSVTAGTFATAQGGSLVLAANGSYTYTPAANFTGIDTVSYTITDGVLTDTGTLTITVNPVNDAPTVTAVALGSMNEDGSRLITQAELLTGSSDIDLDSLSAINLMINTGSGTLTDNGDGTWTFDPTADWNGAISFDFAVSDGTTTTANTASLIVTAVNDAPTITAVALGSMNEDGSRLITQAELLTGSSDVDLDSLSAINLTINTGSGTLTDNGDGTWTFDPTADWNGAVSFDFAVSDGTTTTANTASLTVTAVNDAPTVAAVALGGMNEDGNRLITQAELLTGSSDVDLDSLSAINLTINTGSGTLTDNGDGTWTFDPTADWNGAVSFDFDVSDGTTTTANTASLTVTAVNDAPVAVDDAITATEDTVFTSTVDLDFNDTDIDGDALIVTAGTFATAQGGSLVLAADGSYTYTPAANFTGIDTVNYTVTDGVLTDTGTLTITVNPVNDAPIVAAVALGSMNEDGSRLITQAELLTGSSDIDLDTLSAINLNVNTGSGTLTDNGDGTWTFDPTADWNGAVSLDFDISDGTTTTANTASLTVTAVNDAPVAVDDTIATTEDTVFTSTVDLDFNDTDIDGNALSVTAGTFATAQGGSLVLAADGSYTYTPAANFTGIDTVNYTVTDGVLTDTGTLTITVNPVNDAPIVAAVALGSMNEDGSRLITQAELLTGSSDIDLDTLSAINLMINTGSGTLTDNGDGTWTFEPTADWNGAVSLDFDISDGTTTTANTASLIVTAVNDAPIVAAVALGSMNEDGSRLITQAELLTGSSDVDLDTLSAINLTINTGSGTLTDNGDGTWTFDPTADWNGAVSFDFAVSDGTTTTANTASLTVTAVNDAPIVTAVTLGGMNEDGNRLITQAELLTGSSDVDLDSLSAINLTINTGSGTLTDNGDGTWTFDPTADWNGAVSFDFAVSDGTTTTANTASLTVTAVNDAPIVTAVTLGGMNEDGNRLITQAELLTGSSDVDLDSLSAINLTINTGSGTLTDNGDGTWTFDPTADWNGAISFDFAVSDGTTTTANTASLIVTAVNDAPTITAVALGSMNEDGSRLITQAELLTGSSDVDLDSLSAINLTINTGSGTLTDNGDGTWTFDPTADWNGAVSFDFAVSDGTTTTANTASLTVTAVNDAPIVAAVPLGGMNEDGNRLITQAELLTGSSDVDLDSLSAINLTINTGSGTLTDNGDGTWTFDPTADWNGAVSFDFDVSDGTTTTANTASLTVTAVNDAPVAVDDAITATEDTVFTSTVDLDFNDTDIDGDALIVTAGTFATAQGGSLVLAADGSYTYTPAANFTGIDTVNYTVTDGVLTDTGTLTITVNPVNDAPIVAAVALGSMNEDGSRLITQAELLTGSSDIDLDTLSAINLNVNTGSGTLTDNGDGTWTFDPTADWNGAVSFDFAVSDGTTTTANTASLIVTAVNDAPVITQGQVFTIAEDAVNTSSVGTVTATDIDLTGALNNWTIVAGNTDGIFIINAGTSEITVADNTNLDFELTTSYTVSIQVDDGINTSAIENITINVSDINDNTPTIPSGQSFSLSEDANNGQAVGTVTAIDSDTVGALQNWTIFSGNTSAIFTINAATGLITVSDNTNINPSTTEYTLGIQVEDGINTSPIANITINISHNITDVIETVPPPTEDEPDSPTGQEPVEDNTVEIAQETITEEATEDSNSSQVFIEDPLNITPEEEISLILEEEARVQETFYENTLHLTQNNSDSYVPESTEKTDARKYLEQKINLSHNNIELLSQEDTYQLTPVNFDLFSFDRSEMGNNTIWTELDVLRNDMDEAFEEEAQERKLSAKTISGVSASFAVGATAYLLRAGSLVSSFMATVPLWKGFDPIAVLTFQKKKDKDSDKNRQEKGNGLDETANDNTEQLFEDRK